MSSGIGQPRVVVTGIGLVTGLGRSREQTWRRLREGRHGFRVLELDAGEGASPFVGCPASHPYFQQIDHLYLAAMEAREDALLGEWTIDRDRAATIIGLSKGDLRQLSAMRDRLGRDEPDAMSSLPWTNAWANFGAGVISRTWDLRGPCLAPVAACATGLVAALQAADLIRRGVCDLAVAGAYDFSLGPLVLGAFRKMGVLARVEEDPGRSVRPWDRGRSGFLVGEGAAVLVLEREDHARARGVRPYAELAGGAFGADAYHETNLNPDPSGLAHLIGRALKNAGVDASELDHVNVHGTATRSNDPLECRALRVALGEHADRVACSANKSQIGHLLGAAGAAELAITCLAIRDGFVSPTLNLDDPDPACDLDGTPHVGRPMTIRAALKLSIGFGGHFAAAVLRRVMSDE